MFSFDAVWKDFSPFLGGNLLVDGVLSLKMVSGGLNHDSKLPFFTKSLCSLVLIGLLRGSLESECVTPQGFCKTFCWYVFRKDAHFLAILGKFTCFFILKSYISSELILHQIKSATNLFVLYTARTYLQLPLQQWGGGNVYLLVLSSWKVNIAENPIAVMGL